ncbi:MAG: HPr(Ser) kinase/phosphatase [Ignavibacteria bacterium]|nr:HPr(Ser) kinase/phosphatase [Ignavibacteria bacterium]
MDATNTEQNSLEKILDVARIQSERIAVEALKGDPLFYECITGSEGLSNILKGKNLYRPQLALAGFYNKFGDGSILIFGNTEIAYLKSLSEEKRIESFKILLQREVPVPCIVVTNKNEIDDSLIKIAKENSVPIFKTEQNTSHAFYFLSEFLDDYFAPQQVVHGALVDVYGVGMLFFGESAIGKSELALALVQKGHRLVADDSVVLCNKNNVRIMGTSSSLAKHFMEIRGVGLIDIRQMYGIKAVRFQKRVEVLVHLQKWDPTKDYTRLGERDSLTSIMGVKIPTIALPISIGKNVAAIAEAIALNYLLRVYGYNPAIQFGELLKKRISSKQSDPDFYNEMRSVTWFQGDDE